MARRVWEIWLGSLLMTVLLLGPQQSVPSAGAADVAVGTAALPLDLDYGLSAEQAWETGELVGETINLLNGNVIETGSDIGFSSPNRLGLSFARAYNSRSTVVSPLGHGWTHTYSASIETSYSIDSVTYLKILDQTGRGRYFLEDTPGVYRGAFQERTRVQIESGLYVWYLLDGSKYGFSSSGRLLWMDDPVGNRLSLGYDTGNRLMTVTDSSTGRVLTFAYTGAGMLEKISGPVTGAVATGIWVNFGYDGKNNLSSVTYADGSGFSYEYKDPLDVHNLTRKRNKMKHLLNEWGYDGQDRCVSNFSREGRGVDINNVSTEQVDVTDAYGKVRSYSLGTTGGRRRVLQVTGPTNPPYAPANAIRWVYDGNLNLIEVEFPRGVVNRYEDHDERGNPGTMVLADGTSKQRIITYSFHPLLNTVLSRSEASVLGTGTKITTWDYDNPLAPGDDPLLYNQNPTNLPYRLIEQGYTKNSSGKTTTYTYVTRFTYNNKGQILSIDGPLSGTGDTTQYAYFPDTQDLQSIARPHIGAATFSAYDPAGYPGQVTDVNGQITALVYDGRGRPREITSLADAGKIEVIYNLAGLPASKTDEDGVTVTYSYDPTYGRLKQITDQDGNYIIHDYDIRGNLTRKRYYDPTGTTTRDLRWSYQHPTYPGLLWKEIQADGAATVYDYDAAGNITASTDLNKRTTRYGYDVFNRMTSSTQPGSVVTRHAYDRQGNLNAVTDAETHQTRLTSDDMGRVVVATSPDTGKTSYWYDAAGNLRSRTDAGGIKATYLYDFLNRLSTVSFPASGDQAAYSITYGYDQRSNGKGHLTDISDPSGTTMLNYNSRGRLQAKIATMGAISFSVLQDLTPGGRVTRSTYPGGRVIDYERNGCACRVSKITTTSNSVTTTLLDNVSYRPFGEAAGMSTGNGRTVNNLFDLNGRMTTANPGAPRERNFSYDAAGRLTGVTAAGTPWFNRSYIYDALNRLAEVEGPFGVIQYGYDRVGNRLTESRNGLTATYGYLEGSNRVSEISNFTVTPYSYDARGNIVGMGERNLSYNQGSELVRVKVGETILGEYQYNGFGERVKKTAGGATTLYVYDFEGNLIAETDPQGQDPRRISLPRKSAARQSGERQCLLLSQRPARYPGTHDQCRRHGGLGSDLQAVR